MCGRETQNSISESVHALLSDLINNYQLNYDVQQNRITHRVTGTTFAFIGLREQGRFNIQGLEAIDILWIEEGQAVTKPTMDIVLPTIRKPNSKIFISMNRHVANDPAYVLTINRPDCLHLPISYLENEHCTQELKNEAEICRKQSEKDYKHIWLGEPMDQSENGVFSMDEILLGQTNAHPLAKGYGIRVGGFDIARFGDDKCADVVLQQMGALHWAEKHVDEWGKMDLNYSTGRILTVSNEQELDMAAVDEDGLGSGPLDTLSKGRGLDHFIGFRNLPFSFQENKFYGNVRTRDAFKVKEMLAKGHLCIRNTKLIEELLTCFKYTFDHYQRRILISKDVMKTKYGVKSPNLADSLIMAASLIGRVKQKQDQPFEARDVAYSTEDNLFKIAGVR